MATSNKKKDSFTSTWIISKIIIIEPHANFIQGGR